MIDFERMLGKLLGGGQGQAAIGGAAIGGIVTSLLTTRRGRRIGRSAVKYGGLAALGALAYNALQQANAKSASSGSTPTELEPPPPSTLPDGAAARQSQAALLVRAMIAAAHADGAMDAAETRRLFDAFHQADLSDEEKGHLVGLMQAPPSLDQIVAGATRDNAAQVYAASLVAIDLDHPAEHAYLGQLAGRLGLDPATVSSIHREAGAPPPQPAS